MGKCQQLIARFQRILPLAWSFSRRNAHNTACAAYFRLWMDTMVAGLSRCNGAGWSRSDHTSLGRRKQDGQHSQEAQELCEDLASNLRPTRGSSSICITMADHQKMLNLRPGPNDIRFSATSSYSGRATCAARIFLWDDTDQIVISDIDGTITKSDALGHVFAAIGKDWTHLGIAKLYTDISNNGYRMLYLTSRAIGQADSTREYLRSIVQGEYRLPEGPVIMSPDRLIASLHR